MAKFLILLLIATYSTSSIACENKINSSKVDLFVDTNQSDLEIEVARKAACARGERLVVVPKNYREYTKYNKAVEDAQKKVKDCLKTNNILDHYSTAAEEKCSGMMEARNAALRARKEFIIQQPEISAQVRSELDGLKKENAKLVSVAISGHDGGGHFGGDKGSFTRYEMGNIMADYPEVNEVSSLLLLGCYTGVTHEVKSWRSIFPKVKLIGGYDGSAPLSTRPQGHDYILDIMLNEKKMIGIKNKESVDLEMKRMLAGIESLNAAVWINPACNEEDNGFYYASKLDRKFNILDTSACEKGLEELSLIAPEFEKYNSGEMEPPTDTGLNSPLRKIYDKIRTHQHCLNSDLGFNQNLYGLNDNTAFNLLFWEGVKKNYAEYYNSDLQEAQSILDEIKVEDLIKGTEESITSVEKQIEDVQEEIEAYKANPDKYKNDLHVKLLEAEKEKKEFLKTPQYTSLMNRISQNSRLELTPEEKRLIERANELMNKSSNLQFKFSMASSSTFLISQESLIKFHKQTIQQKQNSISEFKTDPEALKKIFSPTKAAIKDKTRKQLLENVHNIHKFMMMDGLSPKQRGALSFIGRSSDQHLRYFQNPFSWHEYTGQRPEPPAAPLKLSDFTSGGDTGFGYGGGNIGDSMGSGFSNNGVGF